MAINITEGCMDATGSQMVCNMDAMKGSSMREVIDSDAIASREGETIPYHRHCQKTVCSAYGYQGAGKTWTTLYHGNAGDLSNIQKFITQGNWGDYFTRNENNITQDLRSILELINVISGQVATITSWTLLFKDCGGQQMAQNVIQPWNEAFQTYNFNNFGRFVTLSIDGQDIKFHTIRPNVSGYSAENLSIEFNKNDLSVSFNGKSIARVEDIHMPNSASIEINQDFNEIPTRGYDYRNVENNIINGRQHIFRHYTFTTVSMTPTFNIDAKYYSSGSANSSVIEWEFHVRNNGSGILTIQEPVVKVDNDEDFFYQKVALTDQMYVEPGKTNVYVFRADMYQENDPDTNEQRGRVLTYGLAYVY